MTGLAKPVALGAVSLAETADWQQALRLGPVVNTVTGAAIVDVTTELCSEIAKGFKALGGRMRTPIDLDHALTARGKAPEDRRTYGYVAEVDAREDGLFVKLALNQRGRTWVEENAGNAFLSPTLWPDLYDPETPGVVLARAYLATVSLTTTPRQSRLPEVSLARFDDRHEFRVFEDALRVQIVRLLRSEGYATPEWLGLEWWEGDESGTAIVFWYPENGSGGLYRQVEWARSPDGVVTVSGPSVAMEEVKTFKPISPAASAAIPMSRADGPKEAPMKGSTSGATTAPNEQPFAVLLSRVSDEARPEVEKALGDLAVRAEKAERELAEKAVALSRAEATATAREESVTLLSKRVEDLERQREAEQKAAHERAFEAFLRDDVIALGRGATDDATREKWRKRFDVLGADEARKLASEIPEGAHGPVSLSRAPGLEGEGRETAGEREARVLKRAGEIANNGQVGWQDAYTQAQQEIGR